jgi:hypothetical protein
MRIFLDFLNYSRLYNSGTLLPCLAGPAQVHAPYGLSLLVSRHRLCYRWLTAICSRPTSAELSTCCSSKAPLVQHKKFCNFIAATVCWNRVS